MSAVRGDYLSKHRLAAVAAELSGRDLEILHTLSNVRLASASQLERLHFVELARSGRARQRRAVLARLVGLGLLVRSERRVGGVRAGSSGFVYWLSSGGWRLMEPNDPRRRRRGEVGLAFRAHALDVTELLVRASEAEVAGRLQLRAFAAEPQAWQCFGAGRILKPDAYVQIERAGATDHWFVEVDRDTESRRVLEAKCQAYLDAFHAGLDGMGELFPAVIWQVPDEKRAEVLLSVIEGLPAPSSELFYITLPTRTVDLLVAGVGGVAQP
jgi:hypothetical protein